MRGEFPELRFSLSKMTAVDMAVGVALGALWIAPYIVFPSIRPDPTSTIFDPQLAGAAWVPLVLILRMMGYALVTPVMEELFMRSFVIRFAEVYDSDDDFRSVPLAQFTWRSFVIVTIVFLATHLMWQWWVMLPWAILTTLWFYYRKKLFALIVVHGATNATILLSAIFLSDHFPAGPGQTLSLWFLV